MYLSAANQNAAPMKTDTNHTDLLRDFREIVREELAHAGDRPQLKAEDPKYLTVEDVTRRLQIGKTTLWALRRNGAIKGYTVGRRVLFRPEDVVALVEGVTA